MKKLMLLIAALTVIGPAYAADKMELCEVNLQKLHDLRVSTSNISESFRNEVKGLRIDAQDARDEKDADKCVTLTMKALQTLRTAGITQ